MELKKSRQSSTHFQDMFHGDHRQDERREGRTEIRRNNSSHLKQEAPSPKDKSKEYQTNTRRRELEKKTLRELKQPYNDNRNTSKHPPDYQKNIHYSKDRRNGQQMNIKDSKLKETSDKRRWGWAGNELDDPRKYTPDIDYVEMSSMGTSSENEDGSSMAYLHERLQKTSSSSEQYQYNKLYRPNQQAVSRSGSVNRPSPPRSKSLGPTSQAYSMYPNRTQSFTSLYDRGYRGTSLDLRPLRSSGSSQGIYFTETEHVPINTGYDQGGPLSMSLQDVQLMHTSRRTTRQKNGHSLLDLSNVTINDSEIDKVSPCV